MSHLWRLTDQAIEHEERGIWVGGFGEQSRQGRRYAGRNVFCDMLEGDLRIFRVLKRNVGG